MKIILVVALNQKQFDEYVMDRMFNSDKASKWEPGLFKTKEATYHFMKDKDAFQPHVGAEVQFWGTWYDRPDHKEMRQAALKQGKAPF